MTVPIMLSETREEWTFKSVALIITLVSLTALLNRTFEGHTGDGCIGKKKGCFQSFVTWEENVSETCQKSKFPLISLVYI